MFLSVFFLRNSLQFKKVSLPLQPQTRNNGAIAQLVEQRTENPCVPGSIPGGTTNDSVIKNEVVSKRWHNLFYILQFCYIFFWLCCFFLMHLATSCYIPIISGYK